MASLLPKIVSISVILDFTTALLSTPCFRLISTRCPTTSVPFRISYTLLVIPAVAFVKGLAGSTSLWCLFSSFTGITFSKFMPLVRVGDTVDVPYSLTVKPLAVFIFDLSACTLVSKIKVS